MSPGEQGQAGGRGGHRAAAALGVASAGGDDDEGEERRQFGRLVWDSEPVVFVPRRLPRDRILTARLRNDSLREVELVAAEDIELRDGDGRAVQHTATFARGFGRDIYPPRFQRELPEEDQLRLGRRAVRVELPGGTLPVPPASSRSGG